MNRFLVLTMGQQIPVIFDKACREAVESVLYQIDESSGNALDYPVIVDKSDYLESIDNSPNEDDQWFIDWLDGKVDF